MRHRMSDKLIQQNLKGIKKKQIYQAEVNLVDVDNILEGGIANLTEFPQRIPLPAGWCHLPIQRLAPYLNFDTLPPLII